MAETELVPITTSKQPSAAPNDGKDEEQKHTSVAVLNLRDQLSNVFSDDTNKLHELEVKLKNLQQLEGPEGICRKLDQTLVSGPADADVQKRKEEFGVNILPKAESKASCKGFLSLCWETFSGDVMLILLVIIGIVSIGFGVYDHGAEGWYEGFAIIVAVCVVLFVTSGNTIIQELKFRKMEDDEKLPTFLTRRGGKGVSIVCTDLIVGDVISLCSGQMIPADCIYLSDNDLMVNESSMTGELKNIKKNAKDPFLHGSTEVAEGEGQAMVICVGNFSMYGKTMAGLAKEQEDTPLQVRLVETVKTISFIGIGVAIIMFIALMCFWGTETALNVESGYVESTGLKRDNNEIISFLIIAITIIVVAVPEGLPLAVMVSLAYSLDKMEKDQNLVKKLASCETMGNVTTICSDKTGTLTQNLMTVVRGFIAGKEFGQSSEAPANKFMNELTQSSKLIVLQAVVSNSSAVLPSAPVSDGSAESIDALKKYEDKVKSTPERLPWENGNETEKALMGWIIKNGNEGTAVIDAVRTSNRLLELRPFNSKTKRSSAVVDIKSNPESRPDARNYRLLIKGASERVLGVCQHMLINDKLVSLDDAHPSGGSYRDFMTTQITTLARNGLRTIAFGYREVDELKYEDAEKKKLADQDEVPNEGAPESPQPKYIFLGVVGIQDPLREETFAAVRGCQKAGVIVRMVTGDHVDTARFIAQDAGIYTSQKHVCIEASVFSAYYSKLKIPKVYNKDKDIYTDASSDEIAAYFAKIKKVLDRTKPGTTATIGEDDPSLEEVEAEFALLQLLANLRVMARSQPLDKKNLVSWYRSHGEVVAVTGDGTNDAPALMAADIGLAMGQQGTAVAKAAAGIIIQDDNFASIKRSVVWGRSVFDNIRKFVQFQLTINIVALLISLIGAFTGKKNPIQPVQMLWINLIMDTMAALALGAEPPSDTLLERKPFRKEAKFISPIMWRNMLGHAVVQLIILCIILYKPESLFNDLKVCNCAYVNASFPFNATCNIACTAEDKATFDLIVSTLVFNTFVFLQLFNEFNMRKVNDEQNCCQGLEQSKIFMILWIVCAAFQAVMVEVLKTFSKTHALQWQWWLVCIALGLISFPAGVLIRLIPITTNPKDFVVIPDGSFEGANLEDDKYNDKGYHLDMLGKRRKEGSVPSTSFLPLALSTGLPMNWATTTNPADGRIVYFNPVTKETRWTAPPQYRMGVQ